MTTGVVAPDEKTFLELARAAPGGAGDAAAAGRRRDPGRASTASSPAARARSCWSRPSTAPARAARRGRRYSFIGVRSIATLTERDGQAHWLGHAAGRRADRAATR